MFNLTSMFQVTAKYYKSGRQFKRSHKSPKLEMSYTRKHLLNLRFYVLKSEDIRKKNGNPGNLTNCILEMNVGIDDGIGKFEA